MNMPRLKQWHVLLIAVICAVIFFGVYILTTRVWAPDSLVRPSEINHWQLGYSRSGGYGGSLSLYSTSANLSCTIIYSTGKTVPLSTEGYSETVEYKGTSYHYIGRLSSHEHNVKCSDDAPLFTRYYNDQDRFVGLILVSAASLLIFIMLEVAYFKAAKQKAQYPAMEPVGMQSSDNPHYPPVYSDASMRDVVQTPPQQMPTSGVNSTSQPYDVRPPADGELH